jgi:hypothetical protein
MIRTSVTPLIIYAAGEYRLAIALNMLPLLPPDRFINAVGNHDYVRTGNRKFLSGILHSLLVISSINKPSVTVINESVRKFSIYNILLWMSSTILVLYVIATITGVDLVSLISDGHFKLVLPEVSSILNTNSESTITLKRKDLEILLVTERLMAPDRYYFTVITTACIVLQTVILIARVLSGR